MATSDSVGAADLARRIGLRLRDERQARNMSLDDLSRASGVSRAALSQIETRKSSPSIAVMWKIAVGLGIPFAELLGGQRAWHGAAAGGRASLAFAGREVREPPHRSASTTPWVEVYELRLAARATQRSEAHAAGTREIIVVLSGSLRIEVADSWYELEAGDSLAFRADQAHSYINGGASEARAQRHHLSRS